MSAYSDKVIADGAVAYWRLNEASGTSAVDVVGGKNGTISGGVTQGQAGALADGDRAMLFNGVDGKVALPSLTLPLPFTVEAWVKVTISTQRPYFSTRATGANGQIFIGVQNGAAFVFWTGVTNGSYQGIKSFNDGQWHHIVFASDGTMVQDYVDGVLDKTQSGVSGALSVASAWSLGFDQANNAWWPGSLDEVAVYPTALTARQIADHYAAAALPAPGTAPYAPIMLPSAKPPHNGWTPLTPSDIVDSPFAALWVGGAGTVAAVGLDGRVVNFTGIQAGTRLRISGRRVNDTATSATALLALGRT